MNTHIFIETAVLSSLFGTFLGGILAIFGGKKSIHRTAQVIILTSLAAGAAAAGAFVVKGLPALAIWNSPLFFPGNLVMDQLSAIFIFLINTVAFLTMLYGVKYIINEKGHYNLAHLQFLSTIFIIGMQLVVLATTPLFFLFAWEIMSFSSFLLVIADMRTGSIRPALFYLIMTQLGAAAILAGFLFLSAGALDTDFTLLKITSAHISTGTLTAAFILLFFGFGSKAGLFPFHGWLPEAHPQAPSHISALMSGIMLKIAVYGMLRILLFILPSLPVQLGYMVVAAGLVSAIFGVFYSVIETDIKRILAFSSIENLGLIFSMIGISMIATSAGMTLLAQISLIAAIYQSICHALFKSGLFLSAGIACQTFHTRNIEKMGGMARSMKFLSIATLLLALSGAALPPSGTFIGEWLIIQSIIHNLAAAPFHIKITLLISLVSFGVVAGIAVCSMVRFFGISFLGKPRSVDVDVRKDPAHEMLIPVVLLGISAFLIGSVSEPLVKKIATNITGIGQTDFIPFSFNPLMLFMVLLALLLGAWLLKRSFSGKKNERIYHTWDCGQPTDASMEYTATAFSAPIRFFFGTFLRAHKKIYTQQMVKGNSWLVKKRINLQIHPLWDTYFYNPVVKCMTSISETFRKLQNGNIQFYIGLIFITLIITAIISL